MNSEPLKKQPDKSNEVDRKNILFIPLYLILILFLFHYMILIHNMMYRKKFEILGPDLIQSNIAVISGEYMPNIYNATLSDHEINKFRILLFVRPNDKQNKYFLNDVTPNSIDEMNDNGIFYQTCRFGNEDNNSMVKFPLSFNVYATIINRDFELSSLPINPIIAPTEEAFIKIIDPYVIDISKKFKVERVLTRKEEKIIAPVLHPPVRFTWSGKYKMLIELYHKGVLIKKGFFNQNTLHELQPSPILYEVKMSKDYGYPKTNFWFLVENQE